MSLNCYIINLDRAMDRWEQISQKFQNLGFNVIRIPAVNGKELQFPHPDFSPWHYFFYHGRPMIPNKVACYFSHIKALKTFLETNEEHVLICEDDITPNPELVDVINDAMKYADQWDMLRLCAIKPTWGVCFASLPHGYQLQSDLKTASGNGAKIVNRRAAEWIVEKCSHMKMPHDVTLFYEWPIGFREASVAPFPIQLNDHSNNSNIGQELRYPKWHYTSLRYLVQWPHRLYSRTLRKIFRIYWAGKQKAAADNSRKRGEKG
jgi:Glycosyltransferase involved in LPS biosynthesis